MPASFNVGADPIAQPVLSPLTVAAIFLVVTIDPSGEATARDLIADCAALQRSVGFRIPDAGLTCVVGVGSAAWDRLFSGPRPAELDEVVALARTQRIRGQDHGGISGGTGALHQPTV